MTAGELYTSLLSMYKNLMFPQNPDVRRWSMSEIDEMDIFLFDELMEHEVSEEHKPKQEKEVYLSDIW